MKIVPIILCGGSGTRLWPASRAGYPKQFLAFGKELSLFQETVSRVAGNDEGPSFDRPIVVTGNDYRFLVAEQLRALGINADIVLEPCRRDSAAAIGAAAQIAAARDPGTLALVLAADHVIPEPADFADHVKAAIPAARDGHIVTFGIRPDHPATEYGYIRPGAALGADARLMAVAAFVEKPDPATAARYAADGYLWNSGNFMFRADSFLAELDRHAPDIAAPACKAAELARADLDFLRLDEDAFALARSQSVDYAVMEKTDRAAVLASNFAWSDLGSWKALHELGDKDEAGNVAFGDAVFENTRNSLVHATHGLAAVVGLEEVMVIATRDAVLVAPLDATSDIKALVGRLDRDGRREANEHTKAYRPWGSFESLDIGMRYQVKRISVAPGGRLSLQSHKHRAEHWVVVAGTARVTVGETVKLLNENESIYVPLGARHRLENPGDTLLEIIEVQTGSYLGEDDIVRYEDVYNRS